MKKNRLYIWCADYAPNRGEGILANLYIRKLLTHTKPSIVEIENFKKNSIFFRRGRFSNMGKKKVLEINHSFFHKYFYPLIAILKIWIKSMSGYQVVYVNFLPLWNFLLFALLPKKTFLGPITGNIYVQKVNSFDSFLRKYLLNFFFYISVFFIKKKYDNLVFSTDLLKPLIEKTIKNKKYIYNFQLTELLYIAAPKKKNIDILFYNRDHANKKNIKIINFLNFLNQKYKIKIVGDYLPGFDNCGIVSREKIKKILSKTKMIFATLENPYSFFVLDALSNNCLINIDQNQKKKVNFFKKNFIYINYNNKKKSFNDIKKTINKKNFLVSNYLDLSKIKKIEYEVNAIIKNQTK